MVVPKGDLIMNGTTIDTLELFEEFKQSFTEEQSQALSKALKRVEESRLDELATKRDLREHDLAIKADIAGIKGELHLIKWMLALVIAVTVLPALKTLFGL